MVMSARLIMVLCVLGAATVHAHDRVQPAWRGQDRTTYQQWRFDNDANPAVPDVMNNSYGGATAAIAVGEFGEGWIDSLGFSEQTGIWDLGIEGTILVNISSAECNEIWVQVTYFKLFGAAPNVIVPRADYVGGQTVLVEDTGLGTAWYLAQSMWQFEQAADSVEIIIRADTEGSSVDQIVVDTKSASPGCIVGLVPHNI